MTRWALKNWPSALSVTSTKDSSSSKVSKTEKSVDRWLFHLRQNCCSVAILRLQRGRFFLFAAAPPSVNLCYFYLYVLEETTWILTRLWSTDADGVVFWPHLFRTEAEALVRSRRAPSVRRQTTEPSDGHYSQKPKAAAVWLANNIQ